VTYTVDSAVWIINQLS